MTLLNLEEKQNTNQRGVDKKSFSKKEKRKAYYKKYNVNNIKTKQAQKSQNKYIRIRYK